jgi:hypothetical protein
MSDTISITGTGITVLVDGVQVFPAASGLPTITEPTTQTLSNADGVWSFGDPVDGQAIVLLNGVRPDGTAAATTLKVATSGLLYALTRYGEWWVYQNGHFALASAPT